MTHRAFAWMQAAGVRLALALVSTCPARADDKRDAEASAQVPEAENREEGEGRSGAFAT